MTVTSTTRKNSYVGTGTTGPFSYGFRVFAATDLAVKTTDLAGSVTTLSYPADYSVTGVGLGVGGSITLTNALTSGWALTVERVRPLTQETDIRNQGAFFAETHEDVFDDLVMIDQQQQAGIDDSLKTDDIANFVADYYLRVNASATGIEGTAVIATSQTFLQSGTGAVSRTMNAKAADLVSVKDFGAVCDGSTDDLTAVNRAIAYVNSIGGGTVLFPGVAAVSAYPTLLSNVTLQGMGYGSGLKTLSGTDATVIYTAIGTSRITVQDMRIISANVGSGFGAGCGCFLQGTFHTIRRCWISGAFVSNVVITDASDILIEDNECSGVNASVNPVTGFDVSFFTSTLALARIVVQRNKCLSVNKLAGVFGLADTDGLDHTDCDIDNNLVVGSQAVANGHGIVLYSGSTGRFWRCRIRENRINQIAVDGIYILGALATTAHNDHQITGNTIYDANHGGGDGTILNGGIGIVGLTGGLVAKNEIIGVTNAVASNSGGVLLSQCSGVQVEANVVRAGVGMTAAFLSDDNSDHVAFVGNKALSVAGASAGGFVLRGTSSKAIKNIARGFVNNFTGASATAPLFDGNIDEDATNIGLFLDTTATGAQVPSHFNSGTTLPGYAIDDESTGATFGQFNITNVAQKAVSYVALPTDRFVPFTTAGGDLTCTLPSHAVAGHGRPGPGTRIIVYLDVAGGHTLTIAPETGTINGVASITLTTDNSRWICEFDGTNYRAY